MTLGAVKNFLEQCPYAFHRGMAPSLQNWRGMGNRDWGMAGSPFLDGEWGMENEIYYIGNGEWYMINK